MQGGDEVTIPGDIKEASRSCLVVWFSDLGPTVAVLG